MDKEILKLFPQKAFKLLSLSDSLKVGSQITKSIIDKKSYDSNISKRINCWIWTDIKIEIDSRKVENRAFTKEDGEKILRIYFSQLFVDNIATHLDLRKSSFSVNENFHWTPSKLHYSFTPIFLDGIRNLYRGFYFANDLEFENGLTQLGMIRKEMSDNKKKEIKKLFINHFGEGQSGPVKFSLDTLQKTFNNIFSYFLKEDIPLNPEFAVLGINLVTLYLTLQEIPYPLDVKNAFITVIENIDQK